MGISYLLSHEKINCCGCGGCMAVCPTKAIAMKCDEEGFFYPVTDVQKCIHCHRCEQVCPEGHAEEMKHHDSQQAYGGWICNTEILAQSTSGGAFSAICEAFPKNGCIVGALDGGRGMAEHSMGQVRGFRQSKYTQTLAGKTFSHISQLLKAGTPVLFSGTPCQCAALRQFLGKQDQEKLVLVEVICEGVPAPAFIEKQIAYWEEKQGKEIIGVDYRFKAGNRWDYEPMRYRFTHGLVKVQDRWFNPFWSIWLQHLMSRPSCYHCPYCSQKRVADITLGDLWGVHIYCPDRYNNNRGCSLIIANTEKGQNLFSSARKLMDTRELDMKDVIRFQGPMRNHITMNPKRTEFMRDLPKLSYQDLCRRYAERPSLNLLIHKYVWGTNRQKVWWWSVKKKIGAMFHGLKG